ncbi:MAG: phosphatase PAP2 family protein [Ramlibacter sp.]
MWNNGFDLATTHWLNQFASDSVKFNHLAYYVSDVNLFKGLPMMAMLWFFWFRRTDGKSDFRPTILATLLGCFIALALARVLNKYLPFEPRPFANAALGLRPLAGLAHPEQQNLYHWNSFPSDHAALYFGLATGMLAISRSIGAVVFLYVLGFIAMPRIYLGLHYPTDILGGAFLGIGSVALCVQHRIVTPLGQPCMRLLDRYPAAFQTALFALTFELAVMFEDVRPLIKAVIKRLM